MNFINLFKKLIIFIILYIFIYLLSVTPWIVSITFTNFKVAEKKKNIYI